MNGHDLQDAVEFVGQDLIDLAEHKQVRRSPWRTVLASAAALALIAGLGVGTWYHYAPAAGPMAPADPDLSTDPAPIVEEPVQEAVQEEEILPEDEEISTEEEAAVEELPVEAPVSPLLAMFPMLTEDSAHFAHPETDQAEDLQFNYAGLDQDGSDLWTTQGDQVLALDMVNEILLLRVKGEDYQGILAICKDPTLLSLQPSSQLGVQGETVGEIAQAHDGILAINASPFLDSNGYARYRGEEQPDGSVSPETVPDLESAGALAGAVSVGWSMYDGESYTNEAYGDRCFGLPYGRIEISADGQFALTQPGAEFREDTRNACAGSPAMIVGGKLQTEAMEGFSHQHPRTCIGQSSDGSVLMLVIEGRQPERSMGLDLPGCAEILERYDCQTAIALNDGTSTMMWYQGEPVIRCSNPFRPDGFPGPDAFVIRGK